MTEDAPSPAAPGGVAGSGPPPGAGTPPMPCPRCGYDLTGAVAAWRESCPLESLCPECGIRTESRRLMVRRRFHRTWLPEHCSPLRLPFAILWTLGIAWWGPRLWRWVRLEEAGPRWRLVAMATLGVFGTYLVFAAPVVVQVVDQARGTITWGSFASGLMISDIALEAITSPSSNRAEIAWRWQEILASRGCQLTMLFAIDGAVAAAVFLLLRASRRVARVSFSNVMRVVAYGCCAFPAAAVFSMLLDWMTGPHRNPLRRVEDIIFWIPAVPALAIGLGWWWRAAIRDHLRMPGAGVIAAVVTAIGVLLGFTAYFVYAAIRGVA